MAPRLPRPCFVDSGCTQPFPIPLSPQARIHRVVVALNAGAPCRKFFGNTGTGSLVIKPSVVGDAHLANPFTIGLLDPARGYVHVFDDVTLNIILRELDTITDFVQYLTAKEVVIASCKLGAAAGDEELLAHYLTELNKEGRHDIVIPDDVTAAWFVEGSWQDVASNPQYAAKKRADQESYAWDGLIDAFGGHVAAGTLETGNDRPLIEHESGLRVMAGEPRLARRNLASALLGLMRDTPAQSNRVRHVLSEQYPERGYVFLVSDRRTGQSYQEYRERRVAMLSAYCHVAKLKTPALLDIVGIAVDRPSSTGGSEDMCYLDARQWTDEDNSRARELQEATGILTKAQMTRFHDEEWPEPQSAIPVGNRKQRRAAKAEERRRKKRGVDPA